MSRPSALQRNKEIAVPIMPPVMLLECMLCFDETEERRGVGINLETMMERTVLTVLKSPLITLARA